MWDNENQQFGPLSEIDMNVEEIFLQAQDLKSPAERDAFLRGACGKDVEKRQRVEALLASHDQAGSFLEQPLFEHDPTQAAAITGKSGTRIGPYKLLQQIGEGGFGVVYMAEQMKPIRRKVALKIVKPGMDSKEVIARFETERQALAMMDHPNIARVLDAGTTDTGYPYFVMELVKGVAITQYADDNHLSTPQRLNLLQQVCRAVQHAHQKGVIHRDLKPSNVMVTMHDGKPVPKVIDFGVAKAISSQLTEKTLFTRYGQVIGTPQYMSPEQAEMSGLDVDTRSDIYSLGVLVYELLVGQPPFDGKALRDASLEEMRRVIREQEPRAPSHMIRTLDLKTASTVATHRSCERAALCRQLSGELDWITMRALEKDRDQRYETAAAMADDIGRYLNDEPVNAGPPTLAYRARKAWRRNRTAIATASAIAVSLLVGLIVAIGGWSTTIAALAAETLARHEAEEAWETAEDHRIEAEKQREQAVTEAENSRRTLALLLEVLAKSGVNPETGQEYTVTQALDRLAERFTSGEQLLPETEAELHMGLARAYLTSGQRERGEKHLRQVVEIGDRLWPEDDVRLRNARREIGFLASSIDDLRKVLAIDRKAGETSGLVKSLTLLGSVAFEQGQTDVAAQALREAIDQFPQKDVSFRFIEIPHLVYADVLRSTGQAVEAEKLETEGTSIATTLFWDQDKPWYRKALSLSKTGQARSARRAFEIAKQCEQTVDANWVKLLGHALRDAGSFELADLAYGWGVSVARKNDNIGEEVWNLLNHSRLRFHARDLTGADEFYQQTIAVLRQRPDRVSAADIWALNEYGNLLVAMGRRDDAARQFEAGVDLLDRHPEFYSTRDERVYRLMCLVMMGRGNEVRSELKSFLTDNSVAPRIRRAAFVDQLLVGPCLEVTTLDPIDEFEQYCRNLQPYTPAFFQDRENIYVDWMAARNELPRAIDFLSQMLKQRDAKFGIRNPERAWTRVRLAKALIRNGADLSKARELANEAVEILQHHPLVPEERFEEIRSLIADIDAKL
jgi:serine/threonine protein kinase